MSDSDIQSPLPAPITTLSQEKKPTKSDRSTLLPTPPIPYIYDLGNLLISDPSPLPSSPSPTTIATTARTCAQSLLTQLLTTCPIHTTPTTVSLSLPQPTTPLPREKPLPATKAATKWEKFAEKKGIKKRKGTEGKMVYDEAKGEWVPKWGYKGRNKEGEGEWIVEIDEKRERGLEEEGKGKTVRGEGRRERKERERRGERKMRNNERRGRRGG